jgi:hypothetical protein
MNTNPLIVLVALTLLAACDTAEKPDTAQIGTREREVRDSIIGQSKLPGAPVVEKARDVQATARERAAALDSIK